MLNLPFSLHRHRHGNIFRHFPVRSVGEHGIPFCRVWRPITFKIYKNTKIHNLGFHSVESEDGSFSKFTKYKNTEHGIPFRRVWSSIIFRASGAAVEWISDPVENNLQLESYFARFAKRRKRRKNALSAPWNLPLIFTENQRNVQMNCFFHLMSWLFSDLDKESKVNLFSGTLIFLWGGGVTITFSEMLLHKDTTNSSNLCSVSN